MRSSQSLLAYAMVACAWLSASCAPAAGGAAPPAIRLDTVGYSIEARKQASIAHPGGGFRVVRVEDGTEVFSGQLSDPIHNQDTGEELSLADFSDVRAPGLFRIELEGGESSPSFRIARDPYREPFRLVTRAMYLWRCGMAVRTEHAGLVFSQEACHLEDAWTDYSEGQHVRRDATGGWHDAGDYNKYVTNAGVTIGVMLRAWDDFGAAIAGVDLGIPESDGPIPDFLAEIKWKTDWLLKMQAEDGRVHHKISTVGFGGFIMPSEETAPRYFVPWSSGATADFVAMLAGMARRIERYDADYAERCLSAARSSYAYLLAHPEDHAPEQEVFKTGGYQSSDPDERLWAAAEIWEATGDARSLEDVETRIRALGAVVQEAFDWGEVANLGLLTYLFSERPGRDAELVGQVRANLLKAADAIVEAARRHGYGRPLGERYSWGCNGVVARQALLLHAANKLSPKPDYVDAARDGLHHLFGRNVHGRSYVTGLGHRPPLHPHDRRSGADGVTPPWPGYLVGGPNPRAEDWMDEQASYRTNEIAINWNAALIYALAAELEAPVR